MDGVSVAATERINGVFAPLPKGEFTTIVADPPWNYRDNLGDGPRGAAAHYPCLSVESLAQLPVSSCAAPAAHLYLWATNAFLVEAHGLMAAWGFKYRTLLTWVKPTIGLGHYFRNTTEHVLFGVRGKLPLLRRDLRTDFAAPKRGHSVKPDEFFSLVEHASPGPYLELFARRPRPGWTVWGNESEGPVSPVIY